MSFFYLSAYFIVLFAAVLVEFGGLSVCIAVLVCVIVFLAMRRMWGNPYSSFLRKHREPMVKWTQVEEPEEPSASSGPPSGAADVQ